MVQRISALAPAPAGLLGRVLSGLGALWRRAEPVDVVDQRFNFLPHRFRWRGDLRRVRVVARVWERSGRRYFEVICGPEQCFVLFQDVRLGTWHVSV
ncbi:MAG TPA: hypothetical protein PLO33_13125 [Kouleothrix sp.]|uniref:hypothetical protein n=1 Tax=Kouleothrix sp. TaxID=2779161 RepID=UPI002CE1A77A|nr:hypothetical protein [Kouleothrix sp.]HRC76610.1 hypothetical protein [Kouleothrix sp.]